MSNDPSSENTASRNVENLCSVEVTKNSKGYTWSVKAYAQTPAEAFRLVQVAEAQVAARYGGEA